MFNDTTIVIPTFNEAGNIGNLLTTLATAYPGAEVIVADDCSKDGTQKIVRSFKHAQLLERVGKQKGLTASVVDGVMLAKTPFVAVMDADGQHSTQALGNLVAALRLGNSVAVGTRVSVPGEWSFSRKLISSSAIMLGRLRLRISGAYTPDVVSGFFAAKTDLFQKQIVAHRKRFIPEGYKVCLDLLKTLPRKTAVVTVPYSFSLRNAGGSKMGTRQIVAYLKSLVT